MELSILILLSIPKPKQICVLPLTSKKFLITLWNQNGAGYWQAFYSALFCC